MRPEGTRRRQPGDAALGEHHLEVREALAAVLIVPAEPGVGQPVIKRGGDGGAKVRVPGALWADRLQNARGSRMAWPMPYSSMSCRRRNSGSLPGPPPFGGFESRRAPCTG